MMESDEQNDRDPVFMPIKYTPQYKHSSLPYVLTDYGFKDTEAERLAKVRILDWYFSFYTLNLDNEFSWVTRNTITNHNIKPKFFLAF